MVRGYVWRVMACCENGRRSGSWSGKIRGRKDLRDVQCGSSETWCFFLFLNVKVLNWNVFGDLFLSQTSMPTTWVLKSGVDGTHGLFTPETLCCQALRRNNE